METATVDFGILAGAGAPTRSYKAGDVIFREGDPARELYIVKSGKVEVRLGNRLVDTLPELSIFGEMALIDSSPRSATVVAATDAAVVPVGEKQFLFSGEPYASFCAERDARSGTAAADCEYDRLLSRDAPPLPRSHGKCFAGWD